MKVLKHIKNTDVVMCVLFSIYLRHKRGYKLKVRWFNIVNPANIYDIGVQETLFISEEKMKEWKIFK